MPYFSKFPVLQYPVRDGSSFRYALVTNILRRVALTDTVKSLDGAFLEYSIKDGERPEHIAERIYGDPSYHWLVLLTNDIIDPYHDWYVSERVMEQYIQKKYAGTSVYISTTTGNFFYSSLVVRGSSLSQSGVVSEIQEYQPELCKLVVLGNSFSEGTATIGVSGASPFTVSIRRVDPSYTAVHHFEIERTSGICGANEKMVVDPLSQQTASFSVLGGFVGTTYDLYPSSSQGVTYSSSSGVVDFWETYIGGYMGVSGSKVNSYSVSNYSHENRTNDSKRTIKILHPRFKQQAVAELEALLRV